MARLREIGELGLGLVGAALGVLLVLLLIGGSVYRAECFRAEGTHTHGWELGESVPYLASAEPRCVHHSLTRYVLGKTGVMSEVDR
jgi:hypothetical protein